MFSLHPKLKADTIDLGKLSLCRVLLMNDVRYPWLILVPEIEDVTEIFQLSSTDQITLMDESSKVAHFLYDRFQADKMNVAALGNVVPQLHLHHIVRFKIDASWPAPIWGNGDPVPYEQDQIDALVLQFRSGLDLTLTDI